MSASEWLETLIGFVIPTAAVIWGVYVLWQSVRPGRLPSGMVGGVVGFVLVCVLVVLVVLGWELFKAWGRPSAYAAAPRHTAAASPLATSPEGSVRPG